MRNVTAIPFSEKEELVLATDNSGGIGLKENDIVKVPYEVVGYYSFRVALMECVAAGASLISVVIHNFVGDDYWNGLVKGVRKGLEEIGLSEIPITGSTESNFSLMQSAVGMMVIGKREYNERIVHYPEELKLAVIGSPLVGDEVVTMGDQVAPLLLFQKLASMEDVLVWPVGSKGISYELGKMFPDLNQEVSTELDLHKSAGPSTCFLVAFNQKIETEIIGHAGKYYHALKLG